MYSRMFLGLKLLNVACASFAQLHFQVGVIKDWAVSWSKGSIHHNLYQPVQHRWHWRRKREARQPPLDPGGFPEEMNFSYCPSAYHWYVHKEAEQSPIGSLPLMFRLIVLIWKILFRNLTWGTKFIPKVYFPQIVFPVSPLQDVPKWRGLAGSGWRSLLQIRNGIQLQ